MQPARLALLSFIVSCTSTPPQPTRSEATATSGQEAPRALENTTDAQSSSPAPNPSAPTSATELCSRAHADRRVERGAQGVRLYHGPRQGGRCRDVARSATGG